MLRTTNFQRRRPGYYTHQGVHAKSEKDWLRTPYPCAAKKLDKEFGNLSSSEQQTEASDKQTAAAESE